MNDQWSGKTLSSALRVNVRAADAVVDRFDEPAGDHRAHPGVLRSARRSQSSARKTPAPTASIPPYAHITTPASCWSRRLGYAAYHASAAKVSATPRPSPAR